MDVTDWPVWEARFAAFIRQSMGVADAAHDIEHIRRVVRGARELAQHEGADLAVVIPAAWLHDCVVVPKTSPDRSRASQMAAQVACEFLEAAGYDKTLLPMIAHAIEAHSFTAQIPPRTIEAKVVQDADRLDAIGAIGTARCLMLGGAMHKPLYDAAEPFPEQRAVDDTQFVIDHFYQKLLGLAATMTTDAGRGEAKRRTAFMRQFLVQLASEIG